MRHEAFTHSLFLAAGILLTISAFMSLIGGTIDILGVLYSIAFWLIFTNARANKPITGTGLFCGTAKASWIITWVVAGILAVVGIIVMFLPSAEISTFVDYSFRFDGEMVPADDIFDHAFSMFGEHAFIWLGILMLVIALLLALLNILFTRRFMVFSQSVASSIDRSGAVLAEAEPTRKWLMAIGILSCLGILGVLGENETAIQSVCRGVSMILGSLWIKELPNYRYEEPVYSTYDSGEDNWYNS